MLGNARHPKPFVDRQNELRLLHENLNLVISTQKPKFVLISGDFGVGKTTLIEHFLSEASEQIPSLMIGRAKCAMETEGNGLIPFSQLLASLMDLKNGQPVEQGSISEMIFKETAPAWLDILSIVAADKDSAASDMPPGHDAAGADHAPHETTIVNRSGGVNIQAETVHIHGDVVGRDKISATYTQDQVFVQYANALKRLAEKQRVIAFVDDLQWTDASSLRLLFHLARNLEDSAMMFIIAYRTVQALVTGPNAKIFGEIHAELINSGAREIEIRRGLTVKEYVNQRYPQNQFPDELLTRVQTQTEGHALFVSQLFSLWEETKVIESVVTSEGQLVWTLTRDTDIKIPEGVGLVLDERIEQMGEELLGILTCASIEGENFTAQVVARLRQLDEGRVFDALDVIEYRYRLIHENGLQEIALVVLDMYRFVHGFFREKIYQKMSPGKRRNLHRQVGECLEALCPDRRPIAGQLARHFEIGKMPEKAINYYEEAGRQALKQYSAETAATLFTHALDLLANPYMQPDLQFGLLLGREEAYDRVGKRNEQLADLNMLLTLAQQSNDVAKLAMVQCHLAHYYQQIGQYQEAVDAAKLARDAAHQAQDLQLECKCLLELSQANYWTWIDKRTSYESAQQALDLARSINHRPYEARALSMIGINYRELSQNSVAQDYLLKALEIARQLNDRMLEAEILDSLSVVRRDLRDYASAITYGLESRKTFNLVGDRGGESGSWADLVYVLSWNGDYSEAIDQAGEALKLAREIQDKRTEADVLGTLGDVYLALGSYQMSQRYYGEARELSQDLQDEWLAGLNLIGLSQTHLMLGHLLESEEYGQQAVQLFRGSDARTYWYWALDNMGYVYERSGDLKRATDVFSEAHDIQFGSLSEEGSDFRVNAAASLVRVALTSAHLEMAENFAREALNWIQNHNLAELYYPSQVCIACVQFLSQAGKEIEACAILEKCRDLLLSRANRIQDPLLRESYLNQVPANREVLEAWQSFRNMSLG